MIWIGYDPWPSWDSLYLLVNTLLGLGVAHAALVGYLMAFQGKKRDDIDQNQIYFTLHAAVNAVVVWQAFPDMLHVFLNPWEAFSHTDRLSHGLVMAIHIYHVIGFKLTMDDIIHHGVSVFCIGGASYLFRWGRMINTMNFFICGLPGGLDYALLAGVKWGVLSKMTEKRWNLWLQIAIRWPGMLIAIYASWVTKIHAGDNVSMGWIPIVIVTLCHGWNGLYYAQRVTGNTYVTEFQLKQKAEAGSTNGQNGHAEKLVDKSG